MIVVSLRIDIKLTNFIILLTQKLTEMCFKITINLMNTNFFSTALHVVLLQYLKRHHST